MDGTSNILCDLRSYNVFSQGKGQMKKAGICDGLPFTAVVV